MAKKASGKKGILSKPLSFVIIITAIGGVITGLIKAFKKK